MTDSSDDLSKASPRRLAQLMAIDAERRETWQPQELAAMLRHQLAAPIQFDLGGLPPGLAGQLRALSEAEGLLVKSLNELFQHPHPPLELLELTKRFAQAHLDDQTSPLPEGIARTLYYVSIAVALVRCDKLITRLSAEELRRGFDWLARQAWVDTGIKAIVSEAADLLARRHPD